MIDVTATKGTRAVLDAVQRIGAAGGLGPVPMSTTVSTFGTVRALEALEAVGADLPKTLATGLADLADLYEKLSELSTSRATFDLDDLKAEDAEQRFAAVVLAEQIATLGRRHADAVRAALDAEANSLIRRHLPDVHAALNGVYVERADEYWNPDSYELTGYQRDERAALRRNVDAAHGWVLSLGGGRYPDDAGTWALHFSWDPGSWSTMRTTSLPGYRPRGSILAFAKSCGATPRLAMSYAEASAPADPDSNY